MLTLPTFYGEAAAAPTRFFSFAFIYNIYILKKNIVLYYCVFFYCDKTLNDRLALIFFYLIALSFSVFLSFCNAKVNAVEGDTVRSEVTGRSPGLMPHSRVLSGRFGFLQQFKDMCMRRTGLGLNWPLDGCRSCPGCNPALARRQLGEAPATPAALNAGVGCRKQNRKKPVWLINRTLASP